MATFYQTQGEELYPVHDYPAFLESECHKVLRNFRQILNSYTLFHFSFFFIALVEIALLFAFAFIQPKSAFFAISLATLFLTIFSYVILYYYFQGKKETQFEEIRNNFFFSCQRHLIDVSGSEELHLTLAESGFQLTTYIGQKQIYTFRLPPFAFFEETMMKVSFLLHARDILMMQELLMTRTIEEHISVVREIPIDLSVHTSLANAYIALAKIYQIPKDFALKPTFWLEKLYNQPKIKQKFEHVTKRAIEELKILDDLAPNDPWVHAQLATCYRHLELFENEIREYEVLSNLRPQDKEILLRLGTLYFQEGKNAKGLTVYSSLRKIDAKTADELILKYEAL